MVWAGWGLFTKSPLIKEDPYGLAVAIRHDFSYNDQQLYTVYAHMSEVIAMVSQHVETGELIGLVGSTGATTGPHVHFEVRFPTNSFQNTVNPELWISPPQGWGVLVGRVTDTKDKTLQQVEVTVRSEETDKSNIVKSYGSSGAMTRTHTTMKILSSVIWPRAFIKFRLNMMVKPAKHGLRFSRPGDLLYISR